MGSPSLGRRRMLVIKKYPNRRLYDTSESRYITLEDLADRIKAGSDVLVQDATTGADLTQATLTQIVLESRNGARLLPVPLLLRLIRLGDEALAEFLGRYVSWALEMYVQARQGARALMPLNPARERSLRCHGCPRASGAGSHAVGKPAARRRAGCGLALRPGRGARSRGAAQRAASCRAHAAHADR